MTKKDIWMASKGLNVDFDEPTQEYIKVNYGELKGTFLSLDSNRNRLTFETNDIELALSYIKSSPNKATIVYSNFLHNFDWKNHNYSIKKSTKYTLLITVEEQDE